MTPVNSYWKDRFYTPLETLCELIMYIFVKLFGFRQI